MGGARRSFEPSSVDRKPAVEDDSFEGPVRENTRTKATHSSHPLDRRGIVSPLDRLAASVAGPGIERDAQTLAGTTESATDEHAPACVGSNADPKPPTKAGPKIDSVASQTRKGRYVSTLERLTGSGEQLAPSVRASAERRFGTRFDDVRIHTSDRAASLAKALDARAFTHGRHVVFGPDAYQPNTGEGRDVLNHELAHVLQWRRGQLGDRTLARMEAETDSSDSESMSEPEFLDGADSDDEDVSNLVALLQTVGLGVAELPTIFERVAQQSASVGRDMKDIYRAYTVLTGIYGVSNDLAVGRICAVYERGETLAEERTVETVTTKVGGDSKLTMVLGAEIASQINEFKPLIKENQPYRLEQLVSLVNKVLADDAIPLVTPTVAYTEQVSIRIGDKHINTTADVDSGGGSEGVPVNVMISEGLANHHGISVRPGIDFEIENWGDHYTSAIETGQVSIAGLQSTEMPIGIIHDVEYPSLITTRYNKNTLIGPKSGIAVQTESKPITSDYAIFGASYTHLPGNFGTIDGVARLAVPNSTGDGATVRETFLIDTGANRTCLNCETAMNHGFLDIDVDCDDLAQLNDFITHLGTSVNTILQSGALISETESIPNRWATHLSEYHRRYYHEQDVPQPDPLNRSDTGLIRELHAGTDGVDDIVYLLTQHNLELTEDWIRESVEQLVMIFDQYGYWDVDYGFPLFPMTVQFGSNTHFVWGWIGSDSVIGLDILEHYLVGAGTESVFV